MKQINFAHLSDTHLNHDGKEGFLHNNTTDNLRKAFDRLQGLPQKMDFVVITGDVAHEGDEEDYRFIRELLDEYQQKLGVPILVTLGNHDNRQAFYKGYLGIESDEPYKKSADIGGLRVIVLDSKVGVHDVGGTIGEAQLAWLREELKTPAERGTVIAFHHPPDHTVLPMDEHCLTNGVELLSAIEGTDVIGILTGHTHFSNQGVYGGGILNSTAGSTAFGLLMSPDTMRMVDTCAFNLCCVIDKKLLVSSYQCEDAGELAAFTFAQLSAMPKEFDPEDYKAKEKIS